MRKFLWIAAVFFLFASLLSCAGTPVREAAKVDMKLPVGNIEGSQFTGIRYPFKVAAPQGWQIVTQYPKFMVDLGYHPEGLEESEVFLFNPDTRSNVQIDFTPAGRYATFDQPKIERLVNAVTGEMEDEVKEHFGKDVKVTANPLEAVSLKGVPFAAKKSSSYQVKGQVRDQGWLYAFAEPYQIFILYMILEKEGSNERAAFKAILDSFEYIPAEKK